MRPARAQRENVARLDDHALLAHGVLEHREVDGGLRVAVFAAEVDHDAAALQPGRRHRVDVGARIVPVVVDDLGLAVTVRIEVRPDVRKRVPLG